LFHKFNNIDLSSQWTSATSRNRS